MHSRRTLKAGMEGDSGVGKTSFVQRLVNNYFSDEMEATIGAAFMVKKDKELNVELNLWDTSGRERYAVIQPIKYRNATGSFFVFNLCIKQSFESLTRYGKELARLQSVVSSNKLVIILLGNKLDLIAKDPGLREVEQKDVDAFIEKELRPVFGEVVYLEISCKTGEGVQKAFQAFVQASDRLEGRATPVVEDAGDWRSFCSLS